MCGGGWWHRNGLDDFDIGLGGVGKKCEALQRGLQGLTGIIMKGNFTSGASRAC